MKNTIIPIRSSEGAVIGYKGVIQDITEEKIRLKQHLEYFINTMNMPDSQGKKLNFIAQEMGREINTLGSKSQEASMQKIVVEMKDELEKIKEQILNVL